MWEGVGGRVCVPLSLNMGYVGVSNSLPMASQQRSGVSLTGSCVYNEMTPSADPTQIAAHLH